MKLNCGEWACIQPSEDKESAVGFWRRPRTIAGRDAITELPCLRWIFLVLALAMYPSHGYTLVKIEPYDVLPNDQVNIDCLAKELYPIS